jgi:hypothetical protein
VTYLCAAVVLGIVVDRSYATVRDRLSHPSISSHRISWTPDRARWWAAVTGLVVSAVSLAPIAWYLADGLPLTIQPVVLPTWFRDVAPYLHGHQVVLTFPAPFTLYESAMTWQAVDGMSFAMVGGAGPSSLAERAGSEAAGQNDIEMLSVEGSPTITSRDITEVRRALDGWGVTAVVIPGPANLPRYEQLHRVRTTAVLMAAATGRAPVYRSGAWVWTGVDHAGPSVVSAAVGDCVHGSEHGTEVSIDQSVACVLSAPVDRS